MGWKIIKVEKDCLLKFHLNNLLIIFPHKRLLIPISDIDLLLIENDRLMLSIKLLNFLATEKTTVIFCDSKHQPKTICNSISNNGGYPILQKQLTWTKKFKNQAWNWILHHKISNQIFLMQNIENIEKSKTKLETTENIDNTLEGAIARTFFVDCFGKEFSREKDCFINAILDYGYTVLTAMVARTVIGKGLNQYISFYHGSTFSAFPLAYDIVELFRVYVDYFAIQAQQYIKESDEEVVFNSTWRNMLLDYISSIAVGVDGKIFRLTIVIEKVCDWIIQEDFTEHKLDFKRWFSEGGKSSNVFLGDDLKKYELEAISDLNLKKEKN